MTERTEELVCYGPDGAPQALAEAWEIAESIGGATPSGRDAGNRTIALLMVWCGLAAANPAHAAEYIAAAKSVAPLVSESGPAWAIRLARALAATDPDDAVRFAESLRDDNARFRAQATVAGMIADGEPERAASLARGIADSRQRVAALASVATRVARNDPGLSERLAAEAEAVAQQEVPENTRSAALCEIIEAVAATDPDRAEFLARAQEQPVHKAVALAQVAAALQPANPARAAELAGEAGRLAATVCGRWGAGSILTALTYQRMAAAFAASDPPRALGCAHAVAPTPETALVRVDTLVDIATAVPAPGPRRSPRPPRQRQAE